ncbi:MAG: cation:proton antiporter [Candidatus Bathyarchaeota archaeon]|nr:cation:proton antiporter [Candidatus Bathyarchaeota archaeon]
MPLSLVLRAIVTVCILVFSAKILGELFCKIKIPSVLGELTAGILLGPYAFGSIITIGGTPVIELNEIVRAFGEIGGILILFVAGLEMTFTDFRRVGSSSFIIGTTGVVVPFLMGYGFCMLFGLSAGASLVVSAALVATSISITSLVLQELKRSKTVESKTMVSAAVVDDVLGLAILGVIVSFISTSATINPFNVCLIVMESLALWLVLVVSASLLVPKIINLTSRGKSEETVEAAATASCFGAAALAAYIGLSPIVGAFAAGMAVSSSNAIEKIRDYAKKISTIFSPVFFALAGAAFNIRSFITDDIWFYVFFILLVGVAFVSKIVGCGLPAAYFLKDKNKGLKVGIGMMSRGEVGLIVAGVAISAGAISQSTYAAILGMIMITTVLPPIWLKRSYDKEPPEELEEKDPPDMIPTYPL